MREAKAPDTGSLISDTVTSRPGDKEEEISTFTRSIWNYVGGFLIRGNSRIFILVNSIPVYY